MKAMARLFWLPLLLGSCANFPGRVDGATVDRVACDGSFQTDVTLTNTSGGVEKFTLTTFISSGVRQGVTTAPNEVELDDGDTATIKVRGRLEAPCVSGVFFVGATVPSGLLVGDGLVRVPAAPCATEVLDFPDTQANGSFSYSLLATCCPTAAGNFTVRFETGQNVAGLTATPTAFTCPGGPHTIRITGRLVDLGSQGTVLVRITPPRGDPCTLRTDVEPAQ